MENLTSVMAILCLAAFVAVSVVHLKASLAKDAALRTRTKIWLMPLLLGFFVLSVIGQGTYSAVAVLYTITLLFYWVGDVLLTRTSSGGKFLIIGGISFGVAHVLTLAVFMIATDFASLLVPWKGLVMALILAGYVLVTSEVMKHVRPHIPGKMHGAATAYIALNAIMNWCAAGYALSVLNASGVLLWAGAICFYVSDTILLWVRFAPDGSFRTHFPVMLMYLLATLCITLGILGLVCA